MRQLFAIGLIGLSVVWWVEATPLQYTNITGTITTPPQINAISVLNSGYWYIDTYPWPFEMSNNRNFTNAGTMNCTVGFRFNNAPTGTGQRYLAENFHNRANGSIISGPSIFGSYYPNFLLISATNIVNRGLLSIGANGRMELVGTNVDLSYSRLRVVPIQGMGSPYDTNYFQPDIAIYDEYWGQTNMIFNSAALYEVFGPNAVATSPNHFVMYPDGFSGYERVGPFTAIGSFYSNAVGIMSVTVTNRDGSTTNVAVPTNIVKQAVFVGVANPSIIADIRFSPSSLPTNYMQTVSVGIFATTTNATGGVDQHAIYFVDRLASETNRGILANTQNPLTGRPANYLLQRTAPQEYLTGRPGNFPLVSNFLYDPTYTNATVEGAYAGYSATIDNVVSRPPSLPGGAVTNIPGRVTIIADTLNLTKTQIRAEGLINIQTRHLESSSGAVIDSEHLSYDLNSTNGLLTIQNLAPEAAVRFLGTVYAWSGYWSNIASIVLTNYTIDTNATPPEVLSPITNAVSIQLHALLLDASDLGPTILPAYVFNFVSRSTNVVIRDYMTVTNIFRVEGRSMTIEGGLELDYGLQSWHAGLAPNLLFFTNLGSLMVPSAAYFGADRSVPYLSFVNRGSVYSFGQDINADYVEISGLNQAQGPLNLNTRSGKIEGGSLSSGFDMLLQGNTLKLSRSTISVGGRLDISVTNFLFDAGGDPPNTNTITCGDGFRLLVKPQGGDLLGTTISSLAPNYPSVWIEHKWAGVNRGTTPAGYVSNAAVGRLVLTSQSQEPVFYFAGTDTSNALYVDVLDISGLGANYARWIEIAPNLTIYYAAARVGFTPPGLMQPEEYLDGQFNGRLRWVSSFAGPGSSAYVISNGVSIAVNRALRTSRILDSDGDGIPNYYDPYPFDPPAPRLTASLTATNQPPKPVLAISWEAQPFASYQVEYTTNVPLSGWQPLLVYTNQMPTSRVVTVWDTNAPTGAPRKFYRVRQLP